MARYPYQSFIQDGNGRAIEDVTVTVYEADTTTLATIYAAKSGGTAITGSYVTTSASGYFLFYIDTVDYTEETFFDIVPTKSGYEFDTIEDVLVHGITGYQPIDDDLSLLAGITVAANQFLARSSAGNIAAKSITNFALSILDDANAAAVRATIGSSYSTSAEILTGTEATKAIAPDQLAAALFATIGDIPYASANLTPARLAKGEANLKMFMNAGKTAPEWAAGIKKVAFTRAMDAVTGDVSYTGAGFKPSFAVVIIGSDSGGWHDSIGFYDGSTYFVLTQYAADLSYGTASYMVMLSTNPGVTQQSAIGKTLDADGITLTWTRTGTPAATTASGCFLFFR